MMKNRKPQHDDWQTPDWFYNLLNRIYRFDFDPCPLNPNFNGLKVNWGKRNYINPPYSQKLKEAFIMKAIKESEKGKLCVMLLPVSTSTKIFHGHIQPKAKEIKFLKRRIKFEGINTKGEYVTNKTGQQDLMLVVFDGRKKK